MRVLGCHGAHDHWFTSLLYGEPSLDNDMAVYFDGRALTLCAYPLVGRSMPERREVAKWASRWVEQTDAQALMLVAPWCPDLRGIRAHGLERYHSWPARHIAQELIAPCPSKANPAAPGRSGRRRRRALAEPYEFRVRPGGTMDSAILALVERFHHRMGVTPYLAGLITAWPAILMAPSVSFMEAWQGRLLRGVIAVHRPFETAAVAIAMARDDKAPGVADFLYAHMLRHLGALGCESVNLGPSATPGQFSFKLKWARPSALPPHAIVEWRVPCLARRYFNLWGPRTMQKTR